MEVDGNKLTFQPRLHRQDFNILQVIGRGLKLQEEEAEPSAFARRVRRALRDLEYGEWQKEQAFEIDPSEAMAADEAITANRDEELAEQSGHPHAELHRRDSIIADHRQAEIRQFAGISG